MNVDKVPGNVQTLRASDLSQLGGTASLIDGLSAHLGSVNINDTLADVFQPDILYRGFEASPVLGTPQGLAAYQNGVRINEAFGDTVNWDLFPDIAIDRVDILSANPLFGLNALGGAISVTMKNGFTHHGLDGELSGGSFDQRQGAVEFGGNNGTFKSQAAVWVNPADGATWVFVAFSSGFVTASIVAAGIALAGAAITVAAATHRLLDPLAAGSCVEGAVARHCRRWNGIVAKGPEWTP